MKRNVLLGILAGFLTLTLSCTNQEEDSEFEVLTPEEETQQAAQEA